MIYHKEDATKDKFTLLMKRPYGGSQQEENCDDSDLEEVEISKYVDTGCSSSDRRSFISDCVHSHRWEQEAGVSACLDFTGALEDEVCV